MAKLFNRAKMTTATTGSGTVTLGSASNGFQTFAAAGVSNGDVVQYVIEEGANFEIGTGTYSSTGTSLTRSPTESSNSNAAITLAGQATVSITAVADDLNRLQHGGSDKVTVSSTGASVTGNLAVSGTVDGRDVASDGSKLDGIESGATGDQTASEIRALVESASDSNVFTDADHSKLNGIEAGSTGDQTNAEIRAAVEAATDSNVFTDADHSKLNGIEAGATGDQTNAEIRAAVEAATDSNVFTDADHSKLNGIEANATADQTITAGGGLTGGGTGNVTISHSDTSSQASVNGSGRTYIQDITLDTYGHVTGLATATETVVNTDTNTNQLTTFVVEDGDGTEVTISHGKEWKFTEAGGININWTDTDTGSDGDPFDLSFNVSTSINAGGGLTGGGQLNATRTISHADTSSQASINNSSGTVIQDVTLDGYGHVTGLASVNLDGRYYTESEADSRFVNVTGDTMTSPLTIDTNTTGMLKLSATNGSPWAIDLQRDDTTNSRVYNGGGFWNFEHRPRAAGNIIYDQAYHPEADKWTTSRTLSLTGDVTGSVSWDGSGNASLSTTVANDSHTHDGRYYTETEADSRFVNVTGDTMTGELNVTHNGGVTGSSAPSYSNANIELQTSNNNVPAISFHRGSYSATTLYEYDGQLYVNAWVNRAQNGLLLSAGNISSYVGNGTLTVQGTGALGGSGTFTANQSGNTTISISHDDTSSQGSVNNSGNTVIQDVTLDGYGHVTGLTSTALSIPAAANNATITLSAGTGLSGGGNFTTNQSSAETITFNLEAPYTYIDTATGNYGTIKVDDDRGVSWAGYAIRDDWVLMSDGANNCGLYNDTDNEWAFLARRNAEIELYHNGSNKLETRSDGVAIVGNLIGATDIYVDDQIISTGDTNTYMQFHAADQWRVVVGGSERLEVKNSSPHVLVSGDLNSTSDERLKKNIKPIDNALDDICKLEGVTFDWRDTGTQGQGFIAQQVEPIIPDVVNTDEDTGMKSINYVGLIGHLVEAIKTQQTQIDDLKAEIQSMKS